jgi:TPR repeat protein
LLGAEGHTQSLVAISAYCFDCARDGSIDHDREEGEQYLRKASDLGDPYAQYEYGMRLVEGREVPKKAQMGKNLLRVAADSGNPLIQCDYAQLMFDGTEDIHRDRREAQVYFERAIAQDPSLDIPLEIGLRIKADGGDHNAQFDLAMRLLAGDGVDQNVEEGIFYLKKAADGGHFDAIREYSDRLFDGNGVEQDVDAAEQYSRLAEISEHPDTAEG